MIIRTYDALILLPTFRERFAYLVLNGTVCDETFGSNRYLNQNFYRSKEWRRTRNEVIIRDGGCDLGIVGREIHDKIYVHHMNPVTMEDLENRSHLYDLLLDPRYLISTSFNTHQGITFGDPNHLIRLPRERTKGDTKLW